MRKRIRRYLGLRCLAAASPGKKVTAPVLRDKKERDLAVRVGRMPAEEQS